MEHGPRGGAAPARAGCRDPHRGSARPRRRDPPRPSALPAADSARLRYRGHPRPHQRADARDELHKRTALLPDDHSARRERARRRAPDPTHGSLVRQSRSVHHTPRHQGTAEIHGRRPRAPPLPGAIPSGGRPVAMRRPHRARPHPPRADAAERDPAADSVGESGPRRRDREGQGREKAQNRRQ